MTYEDVRGTGTYRGLLFQFDRERAIIKIRHGREDYTINLLTRVVIITNTHGRGWISEIDLRSWGRTKDTCDTEERIPTN